MKSFAATAILLTGLASGAPTLKTRHNHESSSSQSASIKILLGDGEGATTFQAGLGQTTLTSGLNSRSAAPSLNEDNDKIWCGGFKDAEATQLWTNFDGTGGIFSKGVNAIYAEQCQSNVQCGDGAVTVGTASYWCADSLEAVEARVKQRITPPNGRANGGNNQTPPPPVNNGGNNGGNNGPTGQVIVTVQTGANQASTRQADIGATTPAGVRAGAQSIFESNVWCGGFKDEGATNIWQNFDGSDGIFTGGKPALYHEGCSEFGCGSDVVTVAVASYWCADSLEGVLNRIQQRTVPPNGRRTGSTGGNVQAVPSVSAPVPVSTSAPAINVSQGGDVVANIQLETQAGTEFVGETITVNGQPQQTRRNSAVSFRLATVDNLPQGVGQNDVACQVIAQNGQVIASFDGTNDARLNGLTQFSAIQCEF